jgi:hypothetical protein
LSPPLRVAVFGVAWFFVATAPYAVLAHRLFIRYTYFGHAGLALAVGGATAAAVESVQVQRARARVASPDPPPVTVAASSPSA